MNGTRLLSKCSWPSTTTILKSAGCYAQYDELPHAVRDKAMRRGKRVVHRCHLLAWGAPLPPTHAARISDEWMAAHPEEAGYLDGYSRFLHEHRIKLIYAEKEYRNDNLRLVSHPDQIVMLDGVCGNRPPLHSNLEIKTGSYPEFVKYQTAGQVLAIGSPEMPRYCLLLTPGTYKLVRHTDYHDLDWFREKLRDWWEESDKIRTVNG